MPFVLIGLSHKTAPIEIREKLALPEARLGPFLNRLVEQEEVQEGMILSTCNRVEAYLVTKEISVAVENLKALWREECGVFPRELEASLYIKTEEEAVGHLFRVSAGMDSLVMGEPQIGGQVKDAYALAVSRGATGAFLNKLAHKTLNVSKKIRTETGIGQYPVSISYAAVLLAEKIFGDLSQTQVLLIGAGEMGTLAAKHLVERQVGEIWVSNRTGEKALSMARELKAVPVPFDHLREKLEDIHIVIVSTAAEGYLLRESEMREVMKKRGNRPIFLIDIAVPRNIDPKINDLENVYLYDIDSLQGIVESNKKEREKEARKAEEIIAAEVHAFWDYINQRSLAPTIEQLSRKFDTIRTKELEKFLAKRPELTVRDREDLEVCTRAIVNKILHEPIITMKTEEPKEGAPRYSEILKKLFRLEGEG